MSLARDCSLPLTASSVARDCSLLPSHDEVATVTALRGESEAASRAVQGLAETIEHLERRFGRQQAVLEECGSRLEVLEAQPLLQLPHGASTEESPNGLEAAVEALRDELAALGQATVALGKEVTETSQRQNRLENESEDQGNTRDGQAESGRRLDALEAALREETADRVDLEKACHSRATLDPLSRFKPFPLAWIAP